MAVFPLAGEFPPAGRQDWLAKVEALLARRQTGFETLRWVSDDGIIVEPLYDRATGDRCERSSPDGRWIVMQRVDHPLPASANEFALDDLRGGATGLVLTFSGAASARGFGLPEDDPRSIAGALRNVELHALSLRLEPGPHAKRAADAMRELVAARSLNPETVRLTFGMDPLGSLASAGASANSWSEVGEQASQLAGLLASEFRGPFMEADGRPYHDAGATEAQELGIVLATALAYLRMLGDRIAADALPRAVGVTLSVDGDLFLGMAKLRAMRVLWRNILEASAVPVAPLLLHAETSWRMMTARATDINLLRTVAATFAAGLGGADSITVLPHSLAAGLPDGCARRMARNVQIMLLEEAHLHHVVDPSSGSGYVEALTRSLALRAWSVFQEIEKHGGMAVALASGHIQKLVRDAALRRVELVALRRKAIIGVSEFPDPAGEVPAVLQAARRKPLDGGVSAIRARRLSEPFELQ